MIIKNRTDKYDFLATKVENDIMDQYGYYYDKAKRHNLQQRVDYNIMFSCDTAYVGALTFNDKAVVNSFVYTFDDGRELRVNLPLNVQDHKSVHAFFKKLCKAVGRLFKAKLTYTYVSEQGEGGITHNFAEKAKRGIDNNPHIHFVLYCDKYIAPDYIDTLVKYFWQGSLHKDDSILKKKTATFYEKYGNYERVWTNAKYGRAGLSNKNNGIVGKGALYNSHTASGYLCEYLCKDFDFHRFRRRIFNAIYNAYVNQFCNVVDCGRDGNGDMFLFTDEPLSLQQKREIKDICYHASIYYLPRELHSNGVGAVAWQKRDNDYRVLSYKDKAQPRTSLCQYVRRKYMFDKEKHPTRLDKNGKPIVMYIKNGYYHDCKARRLDLQIEDTVKRWKDNIKLFSSACIWDKYVKYLKDRHIDYVNLDVNVTDEDLRIMSIYDSVYAGRRYMKRNEEKLLDYVKDFESFQIAELYSEIHEDRVCEHTFAPDVIPYYAHPSFSQHVHNYTALCRFSQFISKLNSDEWLEKRRYTAELKRMQRKYKQTE